jgi:hypothetical protein
MLSRWRTRSPNADTGPAPTPATRRRASYTALRSLSTERSARALNTGNETTVIAAALDLPQVALDEVLRI